MVHKRSETTADREQRMQSMSNGRLFRMWHLIIGEGDTYEAEEEMKY